ncbi:hypothetical protein KOR42_20480 [Thalassoglobus neptunius]|uniref:DNA repair protein n=1 Tax=Thalassoglobus neptunius TaxID=1938619 RepID=A0A5C5X6K5_9PLAN|nr:DNA repair protein [Thalassoglobus neptunius]TWT58666.1 hypothetical protein KOR42_20480 [Thalassoglobus neptunius]
MESHISNFEDDGPSDSKVLQGIRRRVDRLIDRRSETERRSKQVSEQLQDVNRVLELSDDVTAALEALNQQLFDKMLGLVQEKLTIALQEILDQAVCFRARSDFKRGKASVDFYIEREGNEESIMNGQGGSVANILSVGLRMFAMMTLDQKEHRRFLVLDEQDCWLRPDLVPRLVKMVYEAGQALGFQVLMISHHDPESFEQYADKVYRLSLDQHGAIQAEEVALSPGHPDGTTGQDDSEEF